ncbi:MAG: hypothetical protein Q8O19_01660, partial [Rectinemataceae bacterium]|nr:hypothetical protein [Rectinemataceae bacterium]
EPDPVNSSQLSVSMEKCQQPMPNDSRDRYIPLSAFIAPPAPSVISALGAFGSIENLPKRLEFEAGQIRKGKSSIARKKKKSFTDH